jgi:23S rRNA pseudouridine2605 synthase
MQNIQRCITQIGSAVNNPHRHLAVSRIPSFRCFSQSESHQQKQPKAAHNEPIRMAKLIASHGLNMQMSRKSAEMLIQSGQVTFGGQTIEDPGHKISIKEAVNGIKVAGRLLRLPDPKKKQTLSPVIDDLESDISEKKVVADPSMRTRVWIAHKLAGELVAEHDPEGRPSLIERLERGGVGKRKKGNKGKNVQPIHLKPIGRLDMITEGLILVTNDGRYKRELELPSNSLHRTYR